MSKVILVVICENRLLFVRPDPREKWDVLSCETDCEPTALQIEMSLARFFSEISIKPRLTKVEQEGEVPHYICYVRNKPKAHENGKTWFASRHNFLATVLTDQANVTVNIPAILSRL